MQEKIEEILAKETLSEEDITFLLANKQFLGKKGLIRLGFEPEDEAPKKAEIEAETPKKETSTKKTAKIVRKIKK